MVVAPQGREAEATGSSEEEGAMELAVAKKQEEAKGDGVKEVG